MANSAADEFIKLALEDAMRPDPPMMVRIMYLDSKGVRKSRQVTPLEIRGDTLFAHCHLAGELRQFKLRGIEEVAPTGTQSTVAKRRPTGGVG